MYLKEQNIKHLSFHSYLRKLTAGVDRYVERARSVSLLEIKDARSFAEGNLYS